MSSDNQLITLADTSRAWRVCVGLGLAAWAAAFALNVVIAAAGLYSPVLADRLNGVLWLWINILCVAGAWGLTSPLPKDYAWARRRRWIARVGMTMYLGQMAIDYYAPMFCWRTGASVWPMGWAYGAFSTMSTLGMLFMFWYLAALARRLGDAIVRWVCLVGAGMGTLGFAWGVVAFPFRWREVLSGWLGTIFGGGGSGGPAGEGVDVAEGVTKCVFFGAIAYLFVRLLLRVRGLSTQPRQPASTPPQPDISA